MTLHISYFGLMGERWNYSINYVNKLLLIIESMECYKCHYKWEDSKDTITGVYPSCGSNLLVSLSKEVSLI